MKIEHKHDGDDHTDAEDLKNNDEFDKYSAMGAITKR